MVSTSFSTLTNGMYSNAASTTPTWLSRAPSTLCPFVKLQGSGNLERRSVGLRGVARLGAWGPDIDDFEEERWDPQVAVAIFGCRKAHLAKLRARNGLRNLETAGPNLRRATASLGVDETLDKVFETTKHGVVEAVADLWVRVRKDVRRSHHCRVVVQARGRRAGWNVDKDVMTTNKVVCDFDDDDESNEHAHNNDHGHFDATMVCADNHCDKERCDMAGDTAATCHGEHVLDDGVVTERLTDRLPSRDETGFINLDNLRIVVEGITQSAECSAGCVRV